MITTHQPNMPLILAVDDEANNCLLYTSDAADE